MTPINISLEIGKKRTFATAINWPGWSRGSKGEDAALQALCDYGERYAQALQNRGIEFQPPASVSDLVVLERHAGNASTDFGGLGVVIDADKAAMDAAELERSQMILQACWRAFDLAAQQAEGRELRKGPRGGGRDLDKIIAHVIDADHNYLRRVAWKYKREKGLDLLEDLARMRQAVLDALVSAVQNGLPERGPRGGVIWPARGFVRRVAWHTLDHAWEIEDRIL